MSRRLVAHAGKVIGKESTAVPELRLMAEQGIIAVSDASKVAGMEPGIQRRAVEMVNAGDSRTVSSAVELITQQGAGSEEQDKIFEPPRSVGENIKLYHSTVAGLGRQIDQGSVDVMVVMPPCEAPLKAYSDIAALADRALKYDGVLVVGAHAERIPESLVRLKGRGLEWVSLFYLLFPNTMTILEEPHWLDSRCIPLMVYSKPGYRLGGGEAVIEVPQTLEGGRSWPRVLGAGKECIVNRFARWEQAVCDAMLCGSGGAAAAAQERGCTFTGADDDKRRLDEVFDALSSGSGVQDYKKGKAKIRQMSFA